MNGIIKRGFEKAPTTISHEVLKSYIKNDNKRTVIVGDIVEEDPSADLIIGHGVILTQNKLIAAACGTIKRVNQLITIEPKKSRYVPKSGDIVIGRVIAIKENTWRVDINAISLANLSLSSAALPGGEQRKRTNEDKFAMREVYKESDVIVAEIQGLSKHNMTLLNIRNENYGKLENCEIVNVACCLIKRERQHVYKLNEYGIKVIHGCNGLISFGHLNESECQLNKSEILKNQVYLANCAKALGKLFLPISQKTLQKTYELVKTLNIEPNHICHEKSLVQIVLNLRRNFKN